MKKRVLTEKAAEQPYEYKSELQLMQEAYDGCCGRPGCKHQVEAHKRNPLPYEPAEEDAEHIRVGNKYGAVELLQNLLDVGYFTTEYFGKTPTVKDVQETLKHWLQEDGELFAKQNNKPEWGSKALKYLISHPESIKQELKRYDDYEEDAEVPVYSNGERIDFDDDEGWDDGYGEEYSDELTDDIDAEKWESETDGEMNPEDLQMIVDEVNACISDMLRQYGYPESLASEVIANLSAGTGDGLTEFNDRAEDFDAAADYDEENYGFEDEEDIFREGI